MDVIINAMVLELVTEKESKMMVVQLIAGVPPWFYWSAYLSYYFTIAVSGAFVWTIMLCASSFSGVNPLLTFIILVLNYLHSFFTSAMWSTVLNTSE